MDILKFCDESSLPVALDETIDNLKGDLFHGLKKFAHPGIVAIVSKTWGKMELSHCISCIIIVHFDFSGYQTECYWRI